MLILKYMPQFSADARLKQQQSQELKRFFALPSYHELRNRRTTLVRRKAAVTTSIVGSPFSTLNVDEADEEQILYKASLKPKQAPHGAFFKSLMKTAGVDAYIAQRHAIGRAPTDSGDAPPLAYSKGTPGYEADTDHPGFGHALIYLGASDHIMCWRKIGYQRQQANRP